MRLASCECAEMGLYIGELNFNSAVRKNSCEII